jgi:PIN domain nuclease of toxin-antitoxin system
LRFLLDTNVVIPLLRGEVAELPDEVSTILETQAGDCACSAASLWEMAIKHRQGKLPLPGRDDELPEACAVIGLPVISISADHAVRPVDPWPETKDPFDRLLLSVCEVEGLALLTTDGALKQHRLAWRS